MMPFLRGALALILLGGLAALLLYAQQLGSAPNTPLLPASPVSDNPTRAAQRASPVFTHSAQCAECHPQIYEEWSRDQHATSWTAENFHTYTQGYTLVECLSCHAPKPMLEVGLEQAPVLRATQRDSGVDCLSCHVKEGRVYGTLGSNGACGGVAAPALRTSQACAHCHSAHNLFKEYEQSEFFAQGVTCQDCHMPKLTRSLAPGGPERQTRSHLFCGGGHDSAALQKVLKLDLAVAEGELRVTVTNSGAAHAVPGEINNRLITLVISVEHQVAAEDGSQRTEEVRAFREHLRAPRRLSRDRVPSTQVQPGQPRQYRYPLPIAHGRVSATLTYQLEAWTTEPGVKMAEAVKDF